jgi:hypothetical protein
MPSLEAVQAIDSYVRKCGRDYSRWCVGVAADPVERLLSEHRVAEEGDGCGWITYRCASVVEAADIRDQFVSRGMASARAEPDASESTSVYAFKITGSTVI